LIGRDVELVIVGDANEVAAVTAKRLARAAQEGGNVVLTGGRTPKQAYEQAAQDASDWSRVELWWGDERCVPPDDENSNYGMAKKALIDNLEVVPRAAAMSGDGAVPKAVESALRNLGYSSQEARSGMDSVDWKASPSTQEALATALKSLGRK